MSIESYATLLNLKLIIPSSKSNYVAVDRGYWVFSFGLNIAEIDVDEAWYAARYPDVQAAIRSGVVANVRQHYRESGYFEHRMPYEIIVNSPWYLGEYDDVGAAITKGLFGSAQEHFEEVGFREGRLPYAGFSLRKREPAIAKTGTW